MPYLLKTEPEAYSFEDLERDGETVWDGVTNPQAVSFLRGMKKGDDLVIYHTGGVKAVQGTAKVVSVDASDVKNPAVRIKAGRKLKQERTLAEMREAKVFEGSPLLRQGRLSVVPLTDKQWEWLTE